MNQPQNKKKSFRQDHQDYQDHDFSLAGRMPGRELIRLRRGEVSAALPGREAALFWIPVPDEVRALDLQPGQRLGWSDEYHSNKAYCHWKPYMVYMSYTRRLST